MTQHSQSADSTASFGTPEDPTALLPSQRHHEPLSPDLELAALGLDLASLDPDEAMARMAGTLREGAAAVAGSTPDTSGEPNTHLPRVMPAAPAPMAPPRLTGSFARAAEQGDITGFLIVEHPGPWDRDPIWNLPREAAVALSTFQRESGVRVQLGHLANRPGRTTDISILMSVPDHEGLVVTRTFGSADDLALVDWVDVLAELKQCVVPSGWEETDPVLAVDETSGMLHVERLVHSLVRCDPENVWVTSSLGPVPGVGVLSLPQSLLYASVSPTDGTELVESMWQSRVLISRLVGRTTLSLADQMAEATLRRHLGADAEDAVVLSGSRRRRIAVGSDDDGSGPTEITRVVSDWTVHPALVNDPVLARMMPELSGQETLGWRVVVDQVDTGTHCAEPTLAVVEVARTDSTAPGASDWDVIHEGQAHARPLADPTVVSLVTSLQSGTALDLGCGTGRHSLWLAEHGWDVTAVDFSRAGLSRLADVAADRGLRVRAELADLRLWTPATALFDLVLAVDVDVKDLVRHACRWVAPGGRIILTGTAKDGEPFDHVDMAARVTGARLRVVRASEVERVTADGSTVVESVIVAVRRR